SEWDVGHWPVPHVLVLRRHRVLGRLDDEVGRPEAFPHSLPLVVGDEWLWRRQVLQIALQRPTVDPGDDRVHLLVSKRHVVFELLYADAAVDVPRRHLTRRHTVFDGACPRAHFLIGDERHRRDRVWLMALLTLLLENRGDILGKGNLSLRCGQVGRRLRSRRRHSRHHGDKRRKNDPNSTKVDGLHCGTSSKKLSADNCRFQLYLSLCQTLDLPVFSCQVQTAALRW